MATVNSKANDTVLRDSFVAATPAELRAASIVRRVTAIVDQRRLFPHHGVIELRPDQLVLGSWRAIQPAEIVSVTNDFAPGYGRFAAGGARGGFPSFGVFKRTGAPLLLDLQSGDTIVLLVGFAPLSGVTKNPRWLTALQEFADPHPSAHE
jgi:hypothetical protein